MSSCRPIRGRHGPNGPHLVPEGRNLRYAAIAALGLSQVDPVDQRLVLAGDDAPRPGRPRRRAGANARRTRARSRWACGPPPRSPVPCPRSSCGACSTLAGAHEPLHTVDVGVDAHRRGRRAGTTPGATTWRDGPRPPARCGRRCRPLFPHVVPAASQSRLRAHVGSFADQVYPLQALARYAAGAGDEAALAAAERTAQHARATCRVQQGQWWWHYDIRDGVGRRALPRLQRAPARDGADGAASTSQEAGGRRPHGCGPAVGCPGCEPTRSPSASSSTTPTTWSGARSAGGSRARRRAPSTRSRAPCAPGCASLGSTPRCPPASSTTSAGPTSSAGCSTRGGATAVARRAALSAGVARGGAP